VWVKTPFLTHPGAGRGKVQAGMRQLCVNSGAQRKKEARVPAIAPPPARAAACATSSLATNEAVKSFVLRTSTQPSDRHRPAYPVPPWGLHECHPGSPTLRLSPQPRPHPGPHRPWLGGSSPCDRRSSAPRRELSRPLAITARVRRVSWAMHSPPMPNNMRGQSRKPRSATSPFA